jgi:NAD(P)H-hydrate epimerase
MELAGLSVAQATYKAFPTQKRILVLVGPGNNGGDGLVAARHLKLWGFSPSIYYPKRSTKPLFQGLETQLRNLKVEFLNEIDRERVSSFQVIIDAIFGFSFDPKGGIRAPFDEVIKTVNSTDVPILSVDIASGWDVDEGKLEGVGIRDPRVLVSLTAPKPAALRLPEGTDHYVGGRFIGVDFAKKHGIDIYDYEGYDQIVKV